MSVCVRMSLVELRYPNRLIELLRPVQFPPRSSLDFSDRTYNRDTQASLDCV